VHPPRLVRTLPAAALLVALTACSRGLAVAPPSPLPTGAAGYACAALHGQLPDEVDGQTTVAVTPQSPWTAAWGSPPIVLRCGVPTPAALVPTSQLVVVDGVSWLPEKVEDGYRFTTVDRVVNVEVSVPSAYSPEADALADLSPTIATLDPSSTGQAPGVATASPTGG
jgi:Protein of unknown function (DUF3515)